MGHMGRGSAALLDCCDGVYLPVLEDPVSRAKLQAFDRYLSAAGAVSLKEKICRLRLPKTCPLSSMENCMDQLLWGEMGDFVRALLEGGGEMTERNPREGIREELRQKIMEQLQECSRMEDDELYEKIDRAIREKGQELFLPLKERLWLRSSLYDSFRRLDILQELLDDRNVTEIMVNGAGKIFIERKDGTALWERRFERPEQLEDIIQQIVGRVNRVVNVSSPIADARLEDGSRVHIVLPPVALDGPVVTIRKFPEPITMEKLIGFGAVTEEAAQFLEGLVAARYNIFVSGEPIQERRHF